MEDLPTPRVPHSIEARRRRVGSAYCSISAAFAPEIEIGGIFIGLLSIDHPVVAACWFGMLFRLGRMSCGDHRTWDSARGCRHSLAFRRRGGDGNSIAGHSRMVKAPNSSIVGVPMISSRRIEPSGIRTKERLPAPAIRAANVSRGTERLSVTPHRAFTRV